MSKQPALNKWHAAGIERVRNDVALELAKKLGKTQPTESELKNAEKLLREREQFRVLVVHGDTWDSGFLLGELEKQNFSVAGVTSFDEAEGLLPEANLLLIERPIDGQVEKLRKLRETYAFEKLPVYVFSDGKEPEDMPFIEWMPRPKFPDLVRRVVNHWNAWRSTSLMDAFADPLDALLNDMMLNIDRFRVSKDSSLERLLAEQFKAFREHAPFDQRRFGVALYFYRTKRHAHVEPRSIKKASPVPSVNVNIEVYTGLSQWSGISTDDVYTLDPLDASSNAFCLKAFNDELRAKVEIVALTELARREASSKGIDHLLSGQVHAPRLLLDSTLGYVSGKKSEFYVVQEYIRGPMIYSLMPEVVEKARKGDRFAEMFRLAVAFVKNEQIAHLQENEISIPSLSPQDTGYTQKVTENLTENLRYFRIRQTPAMLLCLDACISELFKEITDMQVQYFDFNDTNMLLDIGGNKRATLEDVKKEFFKATPGTLFEDIFEYKEVRRFTTARLRKVDFNKIFRRTSIFEDISHEFSYSNWTSDEYLMLSVHFLLCKRKENLLKNLQDPSYGDRSKEVEALNQVKNLITRVETAQLSRDALDQMAQNLSTYSRFGRTQPFIGFYRTIRWLGHVLRRYIPQHRQIMEYSSDQMRRLCGDYGDYSGLFGRKRGFKLEKALAKHLKRKEKRDGRHFIGTPVFASQRAGDALRNTCGPRLDDFVSAANSYLIAYQDFSHDVGHLKYYIGRGRELLDEIIQSANGRNFDLPPIPAPDDAEGLRGYQTMLTQAPKPIAGSSKAKLMAARYVKQVLDELSTARIDYDKLTRAGVKE